MIKVETCLRISTPPGGKPGIEIQEAHYAVKQVAGAAESDP
jgi:hypothetical protein